MTKRVRSQMQASEMRFLRKMKGVAMFDKHRNRLQTRWLGYIEDLNWNRLVPNPNKMQSVLVDREVWPLNLELLPCNPLKKKEKKKKSF